MKSKKWKIQQMMKIRTLDTNELNTINKPASVAMLAFFFASFEKRADLIRLRTVRLNMGNEIGLKLEDVKVGDLTNIPVEGHEGEICIKCGNEENLVINPTHHYLPHFEIACPKCGYTVEYEIIRRVIKVTKED